MAPVAVLRTKTSGWPLVSPATRFDAVDSNAMNRAPSDSEMSLLTPFGAAPPCPCAPVATDCRGGAAGMPTESTVKLLTWPVEPLQFTRNVSLRALAPADTCTVTWLFCGVGKTVPGAPPDGAQPVAFTGDQLSVTGPLVSRRDGFTDNDTDDRSLLPPTAVTCVVMYSA